MPTLPQTTHSKVQSPKFADVCAAVTELVTTLETQCALRMTRVSVLAMCMPESTIFLTPHLVNIGGKIVHHHVAQVHAPAIRSMVHRQANAFGVFLDPLTGKPRHEPLQFAIFKL